MADKNGNGKWIKINELKCFRLFLEILFIKLKTKLKKGEKGEMFDELALELNCKYYNKNYTSKGSELGAKVRNFERLKNGTAVVGETNIAKSIQNIYENHKDSEIIDIIHFIKKEESFCI